MLHLLKKTAAAAKPRANNMQTRLMSGGHGHGGPPPTGFEAKVRAVLPQDYQIVLATLGIYSSIILLFKLKPSKAAPAVEAPAATSASSAVPSLFDDEFDQWSKVPGNMQRWEESLNTIGN
ncbi:hypothetical protein Poli38472_012226 [Pythium oligandrum]|uniref:Uncharacterized protein n=1 Tax=Pythium oligandrum TaxID=41045 RepID=A0A8K1FKH1_PYTOL|nr:hypothetical protein Poli38472_012226 [Pythium oligandrum]|eukprot:TMW67110.1 hypothetical protein Poli38472_012226 [Pythium oligandrum]